MRKGLFPTGKWRSTDHLGHHVPKQPAGRPAKSFGDRFIINHKHEVIYMKNICFKAAVSLTAIQFAFAGHPVIRTIGTIYRDHPEISRLIPEDAVIEVVAEGFDWSEGPVWIKDRDCLLFNDIPQNTTYEWSEQNGLTVFLRPAGYALGENPPGRELGCNGMFIHPVSQQLVLCDHGNRCIDALNQKNWTKSIVADRYEGKRLNSPNDLVISSTGHIYFTDPPYGLTWPDFPGKELDFSGVYHYSPDSTVILVTRELDRPNGIGLSPDGRILYVANSGKRKVWLAFDVAKDGTTGKSRVFFDATDFDRTGLLGGCDGLAVDAAGNLWATGPGGVMILTPDGRHIGSIDTGTRVSNCCFGGPQGNELYITAELFVCRVKVNTRGIGF
jgi:gluconolactonase